MDRLQLGLFGCFQWTSARVALVSAGQTSSLWPWFCLISVFTGTGALLWSMFTLMMALIKQKRRRNSVSYEYSSLLCVKEHRRLRGVFPCSWTLRFCFPPVVLTRLQSRMSCWLVADVAQVVRYQQVGSGCVGYSDCHCTALLLLLPDGLFCLNQTLLVLFFMMMKPSRNICSPKGNSIYKHDTFLQQKCSWRWTPKELSNMF